MVEVDEACLPSCTSARYMVDSLGFYVVDGCFPSPCAAGLKDKFAREMQALGAVGFRRGDSVQSFSLQFVNPSGLDRAIVSNMATTFSLVIKSQARKVETVLSGDSGHWRLVGPSCEEICKGDGGNEESRLKEGGQWHGIDENRETTTEDERGKGGKGRIDSKRKDLKAKVKNDPDLTCKEGTGSERTADKMMHEGTTKKSGPTQTERSVFQSTDIRKRKKSEGKEISTEELCRGIVSEAERAEAAVSAESEEFKKKREVFVAQKGEENLPELLAPMTRLVDAKIKKDLEPGIEYDEKEEQEDVVSCEKVICDATLSEDELLSIRWKKTGNLTTYLHNLATFLGNFPHLAVKEGENVALVFPSQLEVLISCTSKSRNSIILTEFNFDAFFVA